MNVRSAGARELVRAVNATSRGLRLGGGSTIGGRLGLALDPRLLERLARDRTIALVTGTNGKTTTTRLLVEALGGSTMAATSSAGANMPAGCVAALAGAPKGQPGVLEVDEGYLATVAEATTPRVIAVLNLSRDQLDRVGEVRKIAERWRTFFTSTRSVVVANADDPLVTWAASAAAEVVWVAAGGLWRADAYHCPSCDARIAFPETEVGDGWSCVCGFARPTPDVILDGERLKVDDEWLDISLELPGRFNRANAAMAAIAARELGVEIATALARIASVIDVAGRFASAQHRGTTVRLLLAKNPAGWTELIELLGEAERPVVIAINARDADGHDPSWLWDVPFERLSGRTVVASGERGADLAVRLRHAGVAHCVISQQMAAIEAAGAPVIDYVGNYTAFQDLRRSLAASSSEPPDVGRFTAFSPISPLHPPAAPVVPVSSPSARSDGGRRSRLHGITAESALRVVVVHPDLLGTYGDAGNAIVLANRAAWRGVPVELVLCASDGPLVESGDIYCLGGGEDGPQSHSADRLSDGSLARALGAGAQVLAVCAGFQILGTSFPGAGGRRTAGLGLLGVDTVHRPRRRSVGEVLVRVDNLASGLPIGAELTGFENHAGVTRLTGARALGAVIAGVGNGIDEDGALEGAVADGIVGTYLHGPLLARNPALADSLLTRIIGSPLAPLDDAEEEVLRAARLRAAGVKEGHAALRVRWAR